MIVEKRSRVRKSYVNYAGTVAAADTPTLSAPDIALNKSEQKRKKITYQPAIDNVYNFSSVADWDDDSSVLETETTSSIAVYVYALITAVSYFAIGCYFFAA